MIKKGFTLAEVLITVVIIGIAAAATVPLVVSNLPCQNKLKFLKAHTALSDTLSDLIADPTFYYQSNPNPAPDDECIGFNCRGEVLDSNLQDSSALISAGNLTNATEPNEKLARLVAYKMHLRDGSFNCSGTDCSFVTTDGTTWTFTPNVDPTIVSNVMFDVNNNDGDSNNTNVTQRNVGNARMVDQFEFTIDQRGGITAPPFERNLLATESELSTSEFRKLMSEAGADANEPAGN